MAAEIARHSTRLADLAESNLTAPVRLSVAGTASDLLLWLYQRVELAFPDPELVARLHGLCFTD